MLEYFKDMTDYDVLFWLPTNEEDTMKVESCQYKKPGDSIGGSELGKEYHISLFKFNKEDGVSDIDTFDAILADPRVYITNLIKDNWYGFVARKTTTSKEFVDDILDKIKLI
jgi:hypothetical protein